MPGLRYPGPTITAPCANYSFLQDAQTSNGKDLAWDRPVGRNFELLSAVEAMPNAPNKSKACRTHQYYAEWMKGMAHSASNSYSGTGCSINVSPGSQGCNSGRGDNGEKDSDDLAAMVDDFIESSGCPNSYDGNDSESGPSSIVKLPDTLQTLTSAHGGIEAELLNAVVNIILTSDVDMLICNSEGADCRGGCIKRLVASQLRTAGYDAAVCKSKWEGSGRVLGGTVQMGAYEYIYVEVNYNQSVERLIVDVDFQDQFVLARATPSYLAALKLLPTVFVGSTRRLGQILHIMAEYVKMSLKQNSMPLPPWRTLDFMNSKWLSPNERVVDKSWPCSPRGSSSPRLKGRLASMPETRQCDVQLLRMKDSLIAEVRGTSVNIPGRGRTRQYPTSRAKRSSGIL
uniref:DUF506 family protein n=2 Tax=Physcomitrium patens TaxID=3218 RepID=A0A2K1K840_PHYPA|nr:uncharacterized protein LOC112285357 [Physcomitrium patens]PNR49946.1 hypothetical protein PHYPA_011843 [Physcomitrium patens]|eukprot:XP_024381866.1 uncharacterized protein LOC112285357 [Physcomitrella patens]